MSRKLICVRFSDIGSLQGFHEPTVVEAIDSTVLSDSSGGVGAK